MSILVKVSGSILAVPQGGFGNGGATGEIDFGSAGPGDLFDDVSQREAWRLATPGPPGARFVELDLPDRLAQLYLHSRFESEIVIRFNGAPATFAAGTFDPTTLVGGESFTLAVDQAPPVVVTFDAADRTWDALLARINATVGQRVAERTDAAQLRLRGLKSGDKAARDLGWQHGSIEIAGAPATLGKLGLSPGLSFGRGTDVVVRRRFLYEPPSSGPRAITRIEVSGSGELVTHVAGY